MAEVTKRIERLCALLQGRLVAAPVYLRVRTVGQNHMVGVRMASMDATQLTLELADASLPNLTVEVSDIVEITAFRDGAGKPVFLHDFDAEDETVADIERRTKREQFVLARIASEEYRLLQEWMYDFSHGAGSKLAGSTVPSFGILESTRRAVLENDPNTDVEGSQDSQSILTRAA